MKRRPSGVLVALVALFCAALALVLSVFHFRGAREIKRVQHPIKVQALVTSKYSRGTVAPKRGTIGADGRLTIDSVPGSRGQSLPWSTQPSQWAVQAQPHAPVPIAMLKGIRALFRAIPPPRENDPVSTIMTLERRVEQGRLLLVDGCFRFRSADGPHVVFPPGARLALKDGYLMIGPPGLPPALSARIGEEIFWEGRAVPVTDRAALRGIAKYCGARTAVTVIPASATVQQAQNDGLAASNWMQTSGVDWSTALAAVRACRERLADNLPVTSPKQPRRIMVDNMCGSMPPPPIADPTDCPTGSHLRAGVCVTPESYRRPVPE